MARPDWPAWPSWAAYPSDLHTDSACRLGANLCMGSPCPVAMSARRLDWRKHVQASKQTSKHSYDVTRPRGLKRISVPASVGEISKTIRVSFHSAWSSMKLIQLSSTC